MEKSELVKLLTGYEDRGWIVIALPPDIAGDLIGYPAIQESAMMMSNRIQEMELKLKQSNDDSVPDEQEGLERFPICNCRVVRASTLSALQERHSNFIRKSTGYLRDAHDERDEALRQVEALRERLAKINRPDHVLVLRENRWVVEHTLSCRESGYMAECEVNTRVEEWIDRVGKPDVPNGRYSIGDGDLPDALSQTEPTGGVPSPEVAAPISPDTEDGGDRG